MRKKAQKFLVVVYGQDPDGNTVELGRMTPKLTATREIRSVRITAAGERVMNRITLKG